MVLLEANIDDMSPQLVAPLADALPTPGAIDVWSAPIFMKKGRPALQVSALAPPDAAAAVERAFFLHSTTLGLRRRVLERVVLARSFAKVATPYGTVRVKLAALAGEVVGAHPEFEDCRQLAARARVPVREVIAAAAAAARGLLPRRKRARLTDDERTALDALGKAAQVLAVGTGESQLHAAAEHIAVALGAESVSLLALLADPEHAYLVADSDAVDLGRVRYALDAISAHPPRVRSRRGDLHGRRRRARGRRGRRRVSGDRRSQAGGSAAGPVRRR